VSINPFVAEVRIFAFNFAPTGWAFCDGQIMPISQNTALFALLGVTYGGDGKSTFALPDCQGSSVMHPGQGAGLSQRFLGEIGGEETVTLISTEMPVHNHNIMANAQPSSSGQPSATACLARGFGGSPYKATPFTTPVVMAPQTLSLAGGNLPHNNMIPYITMNYCIALQGVFPARP
jgi:microcystin-dependent protein